MLGCVVTFLSIACVFSHYYHDEGREVMPKYIKKALDFKNQFKPQTRAKTRTISNMTMEQVMQQIKKITSFINLNAYRNGYKVDYTLRVIDSNGKKMK